MDQEELTHKIIGCAHKVFNNLGFGFLENIYKKALEHELQLVNYLKGLRKDIGLLINFGPSGVEVKRKYKEFRQDTSDM